MYFAIDEAGTHVGSTAFRLIVAVHDETGRKLLGTTCSQPIRQGRSSLGRRSGCCRFAAATPKLLLLLTGEPVKHVVPLYFQSLEPCCRVVANNDIPQGAAHISLVATTRY